MIYDYIDDPQATRAARSEDGTGRHIRQGPQGYALHRGYPEGGGDDTFDIYEDDGKGNGDFVASAFTPEMARFLAQVLDQWATYQVQYINNFPIDTGRD